MRNKPVDKACTESLPAISRAGDPAGRATGAMRKYLEPSEIVGAIENAFRPLECRVDLYDTKRLALSVYDSQGALLLPPLIWNARMVRRPHCLKSRIAPLRGRIELEGYTLDPWAFPA